MVPPYLALDVTKLRIIVIPACIIIYNLDVQLCSDKRIDRNWKGMTLLQVTDREIKAAINKLKNLKKKNKN
jgi:hypothetical protein